MDKKTLALVIGAVLVLVVCITIMGAIYDRNMGRLRRDLDAARSRNIELETELADNRASLDRLGQRIADGKAAVAGAISTAEKISRLVETLRAIADDLRAITEGR